MPTTIELSRLPAGFALRNSLPGQQVLIATTEFYSSEDGNDCIMRLDGVSNCYESFFTANNLSPSQVDHFVAIVTKDRKATIYCNELDIMTRNRVKRPIKSGEGVWKDDIADIDRMELHTKGGIRLAVPPDCGVAAIFSVGWRKGVFYDYGVLRPEAEKRTIDLPQLFGHFYARLLFQELFSITEEQWTQLNAWGWFPFIALDSGTIYHRLQAASSGETISRKEEGYVFAIALRLAGLGLWIATFGYILFPTSLQRASFALPVWVRWIGVVTGTLCSLLMYWTLSSLGKNLTDTVFIRTKATLVTHGPYRWVRHPFYFTAALLMASVTLLTANWLIGVTSLLVLALLIVRTPTEEAMLIERFGQQYRDYMARTGRFIPWRR